MLKDEEFDARPRVEKKKLNSLPLHSDKSRGRFPSWLHLNLPKGGELFATNQILKKHKLNTVCEEAKCPNRMLCYSQKTATFLALGKECTRSCGFCDIDFSKMPALPDPEEPVRIAQAVKELGLEHVVITMVARDDLEDKGARALSLIMRHIKSLSPSITLEVLTSDFSGQLTSLDTVLEEKPEIFNHNIETVRSLTPRVRHRAQYERTLSVLSYVKSHKNSRYVKSGLMVGLGETEKEIHETIEDLYKAGCDIITMGQYLQPNRRKLRVKAFITPEKFKEYEDFGHSIGVKKMYCGPFVRSSFNAQQIKELLNG